MTKKTILMCMMGFALLGAPTSANAQVAKVGAKIISKIASKTGSKAVKAGAAAETAIVAKEANAASRTGSTKIASEANNTKRTRIVSYECGTCDGKGKISTWNNYYGCYQLTTCTRCFGSGKIIKTMRY